MTGEELLKNMDLIDPRLAEQAEAWVPPKKNRRLKWTALAAVAALLVILVLWRPEAGTAVDIGGIPRQYKALPIAQAESAPIYPWAYLTETERYPGMTLNGVYYRTRGRAVDPTYLGKAVGQCTLSGYDVYTDQSFSLDKPAYELRGISSSELVAVAFDDGFCVFLKDAYSPPADFGTFWDSVDLVHQIRLADFVHFSGQGPDSREAYYRLEQEDPLWKLLASCRNAPYLETELLYDPSVEAVSFSVTSEALGVYKRNFRISADGYLSTNLMEWGYVFQIGEAAAREIIDYARNHGTATGTQSYYSCLYGIYVGTEEGYLLIDDSTLCVSEKEGMVFRVPAEDLRISRSVDLGHVSVGDLVLVYYIGEINTASGNTVSQPVSIQRGILQEGEIRIEE